MPGWAEILIEDDGGSVSHQLLLHIENMKNILHKSKKEISLT
jgi:hypothetical protein